MKKQWILGTLGIAALAVTMIIIGVRGVWADVRAAPMKTDVSGTIITNTTWTLAGSPYILTGDLVVASGITLTVEPGAVVMGQGGTELKVRGHLQAVGTPTQPITFTSATDSGPHEWSGLVFDGGTGELHQVMVRYAGQNNSVLGTCTGSNITVRGVLTGEVRIESSQVISEVGACTPIYPDYGLYVDNSRVIVSDTLFSNNGNSEYDYGLYAIGASSVVTVTGSTFQNNPGWAVRVEAGNLHGATLRGNTFSNNGKNRVLVVGGSVADGARLMPTGLEGYELDDDVTIPAEVTLTVEPDAVVMGQGGTELKIQGHLQAVGTVSQPITFTSATDSGPHEWSGLVFDGGTGELHQVMVRYAGQNNSVLGTCTGSNITVRGVLTGEVRIESSQVISEVGACTPIYPDYGLYVDNSRVIVSDTLFSNNGNSEYDYGLYAIGASSVVTVTGSTFQNNSGYGLYTTDSAAAWVSDSTFSGNGSYPLRTEGSNLPRPLSGNTFSGNGADRVLVAGGTMAAGATLVPQSGLEGYELDDDLTVPVTATLTVEPGAVVMGQGGTELKVEGHLQAVGTPTQPIIFTSATDSGPNQWSGLVFDGGTAMLRHTTVRYGGDPNSVLEGYHSSNILVRDVLDGEVRIESSQVISEEDSLGWSPDYGLYLTNSRVVVSNTLVSNNGNSENDYALYAIGASSVVTVTGSTFQDNSGYGVYAGNGITMTVTNSTVQNNGNAGIRVDGGTVTVEESGIVGNGNFGIENISPSTTVQAAYNWWGHSSGPYHPDTNPAGLGEPVSDNVAYDPWLVVPAGSRQSVALALGQPATDTVTPLGYKDYHLINTEGPGLVVEVLPLSGSDVLWVFGRLDHWPLWTRYDVRAQEKTGRGTYELLIAPTQNGIYYFGVYGRDVSGTGGNYQIVANIFEQYLSDVSPGSAGNAGEITLNLTGLPFTEGMGIELRNAGLPTVTADNVTLASATSLSAHFDLYEAATGVYDVYAVWPGGEEASLTGAFTITPGLGPHLEAAIIAPEFVRPGRNFVLWQEYANTGDADMETPLFIVSSPDGAPMRLNSEERFEDRPVQILGVNPQCSAGGLPPGELIHRPIYFRALSDGQTLQFDLSVMTSDDTLIDWDAVEAEIRPADVNPEVWDIVWPILTTQIGDTWGDYRQTLTDNASYLCSLGRTVYGVRDLFRFEIRKAMGMNPRAVLAGAVDSYAPAPGMPLQFGRVFPGSLEGRFYLGPLGRGWSHSYDIHLDEQSDGDVLVHWPGSFTRLFDGNGDGTYSALPGDHGTLTHAGGIFELTEKDGTIYRFRADRQLDYIEDPNGNRITAAYDGGGRLIQVQHSSGASFALVYNAHGRISRLTDHVGRVTDYGYDATGEYLLTVTAPGSHVTTYTYNPASGQAGDHALLSIAYPDSTHRYYAYDSRGRLSEEQLDGGAERVSYTYDANGRIHIKDAFGETAIISPDEHGRPAEIKDALGRELGQEYSPKFNLTRLTDPAGQPYDFDYDHLGNVVGAEDPFGHRVTLGYDTRFSQIAFLQDARGNLSRFDYDGSGNLTSLTYPDNISETLTYDAVGNPTSYTSRSDDVTTYTHNARGQLLRKDYPDGSWVAYTYDAAGNMTTASDASGTISMTYDADTDLLTRITYPSGHYFEYSYNDAGQRTQRRDQDGHELNYEYDTVGRLSRLYDETATDIVSYEYDNNGRLSRETKGNGTYTTYAYDEAGQLLSMVNYAPDDSVQSRFDYTYDANGNRTSMTTLAGTTNYEYDVIGQLIGVTYPDSRGVTYEYDAAGNRVTVTDDGAPTAYSTNNLNQYTQVGAATYTYDANGNMTSKTDAVGTTTYEYDAEDRLVRVVTPGDGTWEYTYDALGNRVAVEHDGVVTRYVHDPIGLVDVAAEYDGGGALVAQYVHGFGLVARINAAGDAAYYAFDATGHTRQLTDDAGAVANTYDYTPFGISLQADETMPNPFRYVGRFGIIAEGNGLSFMRARYYDSSLGRFVSQDPIGFGGQQANLHTYAANNPVSYVDPLGLRTLGQGSLAPQGRLELADRLRRFVHWISTGNDVVDWVLNLLLRKGVPWGPVFGDPGRVADAAYEVAQKPSPWHIPPGWTIEEYLEHYGYGETSNPPSDTVATGPIDTATTEYVRPRDPNEKVGPAGFGEQQLVSVGDELQYVVYFENVITATVPAQEVFVTDYLDPDLDWTTFRLTEIAWGDIVISIPDDTYQFAGRQTVADHRDEVDKSWWVDISTELNPIYGRVEWTFRTLDPDTGELPTDVFAGFLPPNDPETGCGEGHVSFSIRPRPELADGTLITNKASIVFDTNEPIETNVVSNTTGLADLGITKTDSPDPANLGNNLTYTIVVTNAGPDAATGVVVTDTLPLTVTFASSSASQGACSGTSTVTCSLGTINDGSSVTVTIVVTPTVAGTLANTVTVTATTADPSLGNNTTTENTTVGLPADLSVTKYDTPDPVTAGTTLTYAVTITNNGPADATGVTVTDTLPLGVTFGSATPSQGTCSGTSTVTCDLGTLSNGANATVTIAVTPAAAGTITNTASVTATTFDPVPDNNTATEDTTVNTEADLVIVKSDDPDPVIAGETLTYTLVITNTGPSDATGMIVTDTLPLGVTFGSATPSQGGPCDEAGGAITCNLGTVDGGNAATVTIVVTVDSSTTGMLLNPAGVTATATDHDTGNNVAVEYTTVKGCYDFSEPEGIGVEDIMQVASRWRCRCGDACYDPRYDSDGDCDIDVVDIMLVVAHWGEVCEIIGYTETGMPRRSWKQANYVTDSWLWAYGTADFAMNNWGGFQANTNAGDITVGDIVHMLPFDDRIIDCAITGAQLVENLECCSGAVAGFTYTYHEENGQTVVDTVTLADDSPLVMTETYHVLVNDFMYYGGDGYLFEQQDPNAYDTGIQWRQPVIDWTKAQNTSTENPIDPLIDDQPRATQVYPIAILHTNDFHGNLESDYNGRGGSAYMAGVINGIRDEVGEDNVFLVDAGDVFFGAPPISQLLLGESTVDIYNMLEYDVACYGNHEFDKGQTVLISRTLQSNFPWIGANIVLEGTDWEHPTWVEPYVILSKGGVDLGIIGLDTDETPVITIMDATDGLEFKDLTEAVLHYYDEVEAQADAVIVLAHMGTQDSGPYKGLVTLAQELIDAGKPVDLMISGHQHQPLYEPVMVGDTAIIEAGYYGRWLGRADVTVDLDTQSLTIEDYELITINNSLTPDPDVEARVAYWAEQVAPVIEQVVGYTNVSLERDYNAESIMGDLVTDGMLWKADQYDDGEVNGSMDIAFTNPGGLRADIEIPLGATLPYTITWGDTFNVMPFGNTLYLMDLTGAQIQELLDQAATLYKGILQTSGASWYWYNDCNCSTPAVWGAYGAMVSGEPLHPEETYRVVTNNFLAPGGDGWVTFTEGTNRWDTYYDMQEAVNEYIALNSPISPTVEGRIVKLDKVVTILHTNDVHGTFPTTSYYGTPQGMTYLASHIAAERARNPNTLLLDAGDVFQGNAFAQYFRNDTPNPISGAMNLLEYDAMVPGNHEFNFGSATFATMLGQVDFPILGSANLDDDGAYGFINDHMEDYITVNVDGVDVVIFGLTNPQVPRYELPTNIAGLTFYPAIATAASLVPTILATEDPDLLIGLTHVGYQPYGDELDSDQLVAQEVAGIDVIIGGHSHTRLDPAVIVTSDVNPEGTLIAQAYRYAQYLGKINVGFVSDGTGGYEVVMREGYLLPAEDVDPDADLVAYLDPFVAELDAYISQEVGQTTAPLDALNAYTQETTGANVQADAAVWMLTDNGIDVDFHLSGAMSNRKVADAATPTSPVTLTVDDMYTLMPYENSLLVMQMNGPQIKTILERAYRNYYYYKYVPGYGGYSHYTTCMLDINGGGVITYNDTYPAEPGGNNVVSLVFNGTEVDFSDADTYYNVGTVNYLAAGSCNFNDDGVTLWPLDQMVADTQYYVRDSVINYITAMGTILPEVEGRLQFQITAQPVGTTMVSLIRDYNNESNMGNLVTDGMRWKADLLDDEELNSSVDIAFTNPGGLRTDVIIPEGATLPYTITWGMTFDVMPFGNTVFLMDLTGAQIQTLLDQAATLYKGILQSSGITWKWQNDCRCNTPSTWGAFDAEVDGELLDPSEVYRVVTNNWLAAGGDGWVTFAEGTNRWDTDYDMQEAVNDYITLNSPISPAIEGRITYME